MSEFFTSAYCHMCVFFSKDLNALYVNGMANH